MNQVFYTEALTNYGMKSVVYILKCPIHPVKTEHDTTNDYEESEILDRLNDFRNGSFDRTEPDIKYVFNEKNFKDIHRELKESKFIGCSSIMILINMHCRCQTHILRATLKAMARNNYVRLKSKLIITIEPPKSEIIKRNDVKNYREEFFENYLKVMDRNNIVFPKKDDILVRSLGDNQLLEFNDMQHFYENLENLNANNLDNIVFMRIFLKKSTYFLRLYDIVQLFYWIYVNFTEPVHEVLGTFTVLSRNFDATVSTSTRANLYFYNINPTLAIIINNYHFTQHGGNREGSHMDLLNTIRALKLAGVPLILLQDWNQKQLLKLFEYLKNKNFYPLENFLFIMMSHGGSNVIYSQDGELNITDDIIEPIQSNNSLKNVNKILAINACRGPIEIPYADDDDFDEIQPTDGSNLEENTFLAFSVPDKVKSLRFKDQGSPFIKAFSKYLRTTTHKNTLKDLISQVDQELTSLDFYYGLEQCAELVARDSSKTCNIISTPREAFLMIKLIDSLVRDFENLSGIQRNDGDHKLVTSFLVFGMLEHLNLREHQLFHKIFSTKLDEDHCPDVNELEILDELSDDDDVEFEELIYN